MNSKNINSYFKTILTSNVINQKSTTLAIILPGIGYTTDRPLLDYSKKLCFQYGYDVLPIEYGFQKAGIKFSLEDMTKHFDIVLKETKELIKLSLTSQYKNIIFIGKSVGTILQTLLYDDFKDSYNVNNIYLTPVDKTVELGIKDNSLVISGNSDPLISSENREKLESNKNLNTIIINNGDHSLNVKNDVMYSIEYLKEIINIEKNFLDELYLI